MNNAMIRETRPDGEICLAGKSFKSLTSSRGHKLKPIQQLQKRPTLQPQQPQQPQQRVQQQQVTVGNEDPKQMEPSSESGADEEAPTLGFRDWYKAATDYDDTNAQCMVGWSLMKGAGVDKNVNRAFHWFRRAADKGDAEAHYCIGL
jgi:hypothetical protein